MSDQLAISLYELWNRSIISFTDFPNREICTPKITWVAFHVYTPAFAFKVGKVGK